MLTTSGPQRTIARDTEVQGIGFFHNSDVILRFRPAGADAGIVFVRTDLSGRPSVRARIENVVARPRRTAICHGEALVEMVEHVMSALVGMGVDNCFVELDAPEPPGCDGSSLAFVDAIAKAGTIALDRPRESLVINRPVTVRDGQATLTATPGDRPGGGLVLSYQLDYGAGTPIGVQSLALELTPESFAAELAPSRTFLTEAEAMALRAAGIGRRASEADLLIFGDHGLIGNVLRYPDECVRHKMLDMVGDFGLLGMYIHGNISAYRSGHRLNAALLRALLAAEADRTAA
jgi:UDP-3-O-acyl N-acetylglucosamine deacetylase